MTNIGTNRLPRPTVEIIPAKPGLPEQGGRLDLLVKVSVDHPQVEVDRKPLSLALVIDRSGSMSGAPLAGAKRAAQLAVTMLLPGDWVAVVAFDDHVEVPQALVKVGPDVRGVLAAIDAVRAGGSTNLFGGWAEGLSQVMACPEPGVVGRAVLLSDGQANCGVTDRGLIAQDVTQAAVHGVTTTTMGLGVHYDEDLLRGMADAGRGNYVFLANETDMARAFEVEVAGLSSLRGRDVRLAAEPRTAALLAHADAAAARTAGLGADDRGIALSDLLAGMPGDYLVSLELEPGHADLRLKLYWDDVVTSSPDEESYPIDLPWLSPAAWEAASTDERVAQARVLVELAGVKRKLAQAAANEDEQAARQWLGRLDALIGTLPAGEERSREEAEFGQMEGYVLQRAFSPAARYSDVKSRDRYHGSNDRKRSAMVAAERVLTERKRALGERGRNVIWEFGEEETRERERRELEARLAQALATPVVLYEAASPAGRVQVVKGDITKQAVDAVVNSSNRALMGAAGVDGALARAGGPQHVAAMRAIGGIDFGQAVFTPAFGIPATYVIHTAAQPWRGGVREREVLRQCHEAAFALAAQLGARSVAVPAIGTGRYAFPPEIAAPIAAGVAKSWLQRGAFDLIRFVVFDDVTGKAFAEAVESW